MSVTVSVERLRVWLLVGVGLLVAVVAAFLGFAHYRAHRFLTELPSKLGIDVRQETNGFTYSQSVQGRTVYTVHAAKAIQHKDGKYTLRDVGIVLYGRSGDRTDRISGSEFEYDQAAGVIRAMGEVHLDLQAPAPAPNDAAAGETKDAVKPHDSGSHEANHKDDKDERLIHVKTSGLVYLQKLGVAATEKDIEFESGGVTGHAVGADYNSDTGVVVLHSAVKAFGLQRGQPVSLTASRAELDRATQKVVLAQAKYMSVGGGKDAGQTAQAQHVIVHLRKDGSAERVEAEGAVTLTNSEGTTVTAPRGEAILNAENQLQSAVMLDGVKYGLDDSLRHAAGESKEGRAAFDKVGKLSQIVLTGAVHMHERVRSSDALNEPWNERDLSANTVNLAVETDREGKARLQQAKAIGGAHLQVVTAVANKSGKAESTRSALSGDTLVAHFERENNTDRVELVTGEGHTSLRRVNAAGAVNTSSGDSLEVHFRPVAAAGVRAASGRKDEKKNAVGQDAQEISTAVQQGHVVMTQTPVQKPGEAAPQEERAIAERAVYDGAIDTLTLTGKVQLTDEGSILWADRVVAKQATGDATADGSVKVSYLQQGSKPGANDEPVHVLAERAELKHDAQQAIFYGVAGRAARLWQGGSRVEAPVLQFEQGQRRLVARGAGQGTAMAVHTILVNRGQDNGDGKGSPDKGAASPRKASVVRVASRELVYSDEARKAEFTGGVQVDSTDGRMQGQQVVVYLQAAKEKGGDKIVGSKPGNAQMGQSGFMGGSVERMVATGGIELDQPGRRASGEQLVYTASDGMFVLTGTTAASPKVFDEQRGTITGAALRFHSGDQSVVVSNEGNSGAGQRVRTETRVKK
jgi:lipopolysaccharide export system protein LptA